jgi:hypothetical protein
MSLLNLRMFSAARPRRLGCLANTYEGNLRSPFGKHAELRNLDKRCFICNPRSDVKQMRAPGIRVVTESGAAVGRVDRLVVR